MLSVATMWVKLDTHIYIFVANKMAICVCVIWRLEMDLPNHSEIFCVCVWQRDMSRRSPFKCVPQSNELAVSTTSNRIPFYSDRKWRHLYWCEFAWHECCVRETERAQSNKLTQMSNASKCECSDIMPIAEMDAWWNCCCVCESVSPWMKCACTNDPALICIVLLLFLA